MNSSGMKRGLAATAVSALAVAGLPFLAGSASATPINNGMAAGAVDLISGDGVTNWETGNDGVDNQVHLVARAGATTQEVSFEYESPAGTWNQIARVPAANGVFSTYWTPPGALSGGPINVRAQGYQSNNTTTGVDNNSRTYNPGSLGVDVAGAAGSAIGIFSQPYAGPNNHDLAVASGTSASGTVRTSAVGFAAPTAADIISAANAQGIHTWSDAVDLGTSGVYASSPTPNELAVHADTGASGSDDVEAFAAYKQTISSVTISPAAQVPSGGNANIVITVKDQNGNPIAGAQVSRSFFGITGPLSSNTASASDYTNAQGQVTYSRGALADESYRFWVNTTNNTAYQNGTDFEVTTQVTSYTPAPTTLVATSADGPAFDLDEYASGDFKVKVTDQEGAPLAGQTVRYVWFFAPFAASGTNTAWNTAPLGESLATTGADGNATVAFPTTVPPQFPNGGTEGTYTLRAYVNTNGTPGFQAGEPALSTDFKAGQATPKFDAGTRQQELAGTKPTVTGKLVLDDGTALPGRTVNFQYAPGTAESGAANATIAAQADQPAGTNRISDTLASALTDGTGSFAVKLSDPVATPQGKEKGGVLTGVFGPGLGSTPQSASLTVDFLRSLAPATITQVSQTNLIGGDATPGRPVAVKFQVKNAQGDILSDVPVSAITDHGFFTPLDGSGNLIPDPAPADGADYGVWKKGAAADNTLVSSDADGTVSEVVAIERDAGFDDDGEVAANVVARAGTATGTSVVNFNTLYDGAAAPLNGGGVSISLSENQESTVLPDARVDQVVGFRVEATDSFGNLVEDEVTVGDDTSNAGVFGGAHNGNADADVNSQFSDDTDANVLAASWTPDTVQTVDATYKPGSTVYYDDPSTVAVDLTVNTSGTDTFNDAADPINWYTVDWADEATVLEITSDESGTVPVGTAVHTEVTAIDQLGQPIDDLEVKFVRKGPNAEGGDVNEFDDTNSNGVASYDWVGTEAGTAQVTGFVYNTWGPPTVSDDELVEKLTEGEIKFGSTPVSINLALKGSNDGNQDVIKVTANNVAAGLTAKVFVNGKQVKSHALNGSGDFTFKVKDKNGSKKTKYTVKVAATADTNAANKSIQVK